jgi:hypothetical protein
MSANILQQMESTEDPVLLTRDRPWMVKKFISEWNLSTQEPKTFINEPVRYRFFCSASRVAYPAKILFQTGPQRNRISKKIRIYDTERGSDSLALFPVFTQVGRGRRQQMRPNNTRISTD